jgi:hypothetical protein
MLTFTVSHSHNSNLTVTREIRNYYSSVHPHSSIIEKGGYELHKAGSCILEPVNDPRQLTNL